MPSTVKTRMVAELATKFRAMPHAILIDFTGLNVGLSDKLRSTLQEQGATMFVVRNSLAVLALRQVELPDLAELVTGPTAFITGGDDPAALAKAVRDWGRKEHRLTLHGGLLDGRALDPSEVQGLASLPPLHVLHALVVGAIASPLTGFIGALQAIVRSFVGVIKAIAEKEEPNGEREA